MGLVSFTTGRYFVLVTANKPSRQTFQHKKALPQRLLAGDCVIHNCYLDSSILHNSWNNQNLNYLSWFLLKYIHLLWDTSMGDKVDLLASMWKNIKKRHCIDESSCSEFTLNDSFTSRTIEFLYSLKCVSGLTVAQWLECIFVT